MSSIAAEDGTLSDKKQERQLNIWLTEYTAANSTRDHYDSTRWLVGSIFIAAIFTMFASSFLDQVPQDNLALGLLAVSSTMLWFVFVFYDQHTQPWINAAIDRCHKIENILRNQEYDIYLHAWIKFARTKAEKEYDKDEVDYDRKLSLTGGFNHSAIYVIYLFSAMIPVAWIIRLVPNQYGVVGAAIIIAITLLWPVRKQLEAERKEREEEEERRKSRMQQTSHRHGAET